MIEQISEKKELVQRKFYPKGRRISLEDFVSLEFFLVNADDNNFCAASFSKDSEGNRVFCGKPAEVYAETNREGQNREMLFLCTECERNLREHCLS